MTRPVDAALIAELFDRYAATLEFYAAQWAASPQDCVQEAFFELARQSPPPADVGSWLFRVVRNRALNAMRAAKRRASHEQIAARRYSEGKQRPDPSDAVAVSDLLQWLPSEQRELVVLRVWGRLSWQEIADIVGGSRSAAQRNYAQALERLRNEWEPDLCPKTTPNHHA